MTDLEGRVQRLEDRQAIIEVVMSYCVAVDRRDWTMFEELFAPTVRTDDAELSKAEFVAIVRGALPGFSSTQHLSTNHLVAFDPGDPDLATCESDMYAQHFLDASANGTYYLLRARYADVLTRTANGWRISAITTSNRWEEGNLNAVAEARERVRLNGGSTT